MFKGRFSFKAAQAVTNENNTLDQLETLERHSLIQVMHTDNETCFQLTDSIRDYALSKQNTSHSTAQARHANYYIHQAEERMDEFGLPDGNSLQWFTQNHDELTAIVRRFAGQSIALRASLALAHAQIHHGPYDLLLQLLEQAKVDLKHLKDPLQQAGNQWKPITTQGPPP